MYANTFAPKSMPAHGCRFMRSPLIFSDILSADIARIMSGKKNQNNVCARNILNFGKVDRVEYEQGII